MANFPKIRNLANSHLAEWKTVMVQFQKKMIELLGIWKRIRQISRDFLRRFEELSLANGDTDAKFPLSMEYHLIYVFTDELRGKGLEAHSAWSSESTSQRPSIGRYILLCMIV